jgi:ferredoxin-fold anticodon binding domain-containing protein
MEELSIINNYIEEYNKKKNAKSITNELVAIIGNIDCLLNHKNFVY